MVDTPGHEQFPLHITLTRCIGSFVFFTTILTGVAIPSFLRVVCRARAEY